MRRDVIRSFRMPTTLERDVTRLAAAHGMTFSDAAREGLRMIGVLPSEAELEALEAAAEAEALEAVE